MQTKVLLKDISKCDKTPKKKQSFFCFEEGGREKGTGEGNNQRSQKYCNFEGLEVPRQACVPSTPPYCPPPCVQRTR